MRTCWSTRSHTRTRAIVWATSWPYAPTFCTGVAPVDPGMPDSASIPDHPCSTARATRPSQSSPAATVTLAPPHMSSESTRTPRVATLTTVPGNPASATTTFEPAAHDEQRFLGVVDLAHGIHELVRGLDDDHASRRAPHPHRRVRGDGLVVQLLHQSSRTTATQRPRTFSPPHVVVTSTVTRPLPASTALTTPSTTISAPADRHDDRLGEARAELDDPSGVPCPVGHHRAGRSPGSTSRAR